MMNVPKYLEKPVVRKEAVYFMAGTALLKGQALCTDLDYYTSTEGQAVTDPWFARGNVVALPSATNNQAFRGVVLQDHAAHTGGYWVEIGTPGSCVEVLSLLDTTIGSTYMTFLAGSGAPGYFFTAGFGGRGTAIALQTTTTSVLKTVLDGSGALDSTGKIITTSGLTVAGVAAGDKVAVLGVEDDDTNSGTPGIYTITAVTDTTITVSEAVSDGGTMQCSFVAFTGSPTVFAYLCDGEESGGVEFVQPPNKGHATDPTFTVMSGGYTFLGGGYTSATEAARAVFPAGAYLGQKKAFKCLGAVGGSYDIILAPAASGWQQTVTDAIETAGDGKPLALVSVSFDAANEVLLAQWWGVWCELYHSGCVIAAT